MGVSDPVDLLRGLVGIPSLSGHEAEATRWLVAWMNGQGFDAAVDQAGNAVGIRGSGTRHVLLLSHIDTFPGEIPVRREGDWLTGRGAVDAKGSLCAFASAAAATDILPGWQLTVVGAVEEETASSRGARHLLAAAAKPQYCVIGEPSGWERLTLGYKGRLVADLQWRAAFSHSAGPGRLPAEQAVDIWSAVVAHCSQFNTGRETIFDRLDPSLRHIVTRDQGAYCSVEMTIGFRLPPSLQPMALAGDIQRLVWAAHLAPRPVSPRNARDFSKTGDDRGLKVPLRPPCAPLRRQGTIENGGPPRDACGTVENTGLSPLCGEADTDDQRNCLVFSGQETAFRADKSNPLVRAFLSAIRRTGGQPRFVLKTGTSDMNVVGPFWGVPIIAYGPGDSALDHTPEERINLNEFLRAIEVIKNALEILQRSTP